MVGKASPVKTSPKREKAYFSEGAVKNVWDRGERGRVFSEKRDMKRREGPAGRGTSGVALKRHGDYVAGGEGNGFRSPRGGSTKKTASTFWSSRPEKRIKRRSQKAGVEGGQEVLLP